MLLALVLGACSLLGVVAIGTLTERLADELIPARKTGLGSDGIVDQEGVVSREFSAAVPGAVPEGVVQVAGELWRARSSTTPAPLVGSRVRVRAVEGMVAFVEPV